MDYRRLDYHRLDYFGLQRRLDYKDIWTIAVWTTKTNRLKVFRLLGLTEIVHYDHVRLYANTFIHALLAGNEEGISN